MARIVEEINRRYDRLDAVVFPGGYLRLNRTVGQMSYPERRSALDDAGLVKPLKSIVKCLKTSPGACLVVGVDGPVFANGDDPDQLCVAVDRAGIKGMARKIFPIAGSKEADYLLSYDADFYEPRRIIQLASGRKAVLAACYDLFGVAERGDVQGKRARNIQWIGEYKAPLERGQKGFDERLARNLAEFENLLATENVTVGVAAIHDFPTHRTGFWQRHGIASCSAGLGRGYAIGAAHFWHRLPPRPNVSTLSAAKVPASHLVQGFYRQAHGWHPADHFVVECNLGKALVRVFA